MYKFANQLVVVWAGPAMAFAGARVELRPTPEIPPGGYEPHCDVRVDAYLVDTGNPGFGDIAFTHLSVDLSASFLEDGLSFTPLDDRFCCGCPASFEWAADDCAAFCFTCFPLDHVSWDGPGFVLPDDGELYLGHMEVNVGDLGGTVDVLNANDPTTGEGAQAFFHVGGPGGPNILWTAYDGDLTGGQVTLMVNSGSPQIVSSDPPHDAVDARQPTDPLGMNPEGWSQIDLVFNVALCIPTSFEFEVSEEGGDGFVPWVTWVEYFSEYAVRVHLFEPIEPGAWTTITHLPTGASMRVGYLPGDANGDGASSPMDILALIDSLNGVAELPSYSTDINRSGMAEPSDVLRLIDLLNGAGAFDAWNGATLP